jgi:hypothetical protein
MGAWSGDVGASSPTGLSAVLAASRSAQAQPRDYPRCAWSGWDANNCGFVTLQQCLATVSAPAASAGVRSLYYDEEL